MVSLNVQEPSIQEMFALPFPVRPFTVDEYEAMARTGILNEDHRVELLEGLIVPKMTKNPLHESVIATIQWKLNLQLPVGFHVRLQSAITTDDSCPEPDLALVRGETIDYRNRHPKPSDILLVIEVSESSLNRDRKKRRIYARAGIGHYWIVNLIDMQVEVYTDPTSGRIEPEYLTAQKFSALDTISVSLSNDVLIDLPLNEILVKS